MKIKAIIFDSNGVLQLGGDYDKKGFKGHHTLGFHKYIVKKLKIELDTWIDSIDTPYAKAIEGLISEKETVKTISQNLGISVGKLRKIVIAGYKKAFKKNKELYKIAYDLKKQGYKIGILSDQWYLSKKALLSKKNIKKFNPIIVSCDVGIRKPNPKIYKLLIRKCKCKPCEILFVDNRDWNTIPAEKLGIKTILFKDNKQFIKDLKKFDIEV